MEKRGNAMYVFKNAFKNISIFKTRNILMFIIIFMMSFLCCLSLIVWQGAKKYEKSNTALMNISVDFGDDAYRSNVNTAAVFYEGMGTSISFKILLDQNAQTLDELHRFIDVDDRVVSYDIVNTQLTGSENFKSYALDSNMLYFPLTKSKTVTAFSDRQYVSIVGHDPKVSLGRTDQNRFFRIEKGEMFDDTSSEYECIIDGQLAEERNLQVGDKIDVYLNDLEYELEVTGIYNSFYIETYIDNLAEQKNSVKDIKPNLVDQPNFSSIIYLPSIYVNTPFYEEIRMKRSVGLDMNFNVMGLSSDVVMTDFIQGNKTITYGKVFDPSSDAYECLISEDLARKNGVKVGDEIILRGYIEGSRDYRVKISGIYGNSIDDDIGLPMYQVPPSDVYSGDALVMPLDTIYMSFSALMKILNDIDSYAFTPYPKTVNLKLLFQNTKDMNDFYFKVSREDFKMREKFDTATEDTKEYFNQLTVIKRTTSYALATFAIAIVVTIVFLFLFNAYNMRERQYEIGVLTSMGMRKGKMALQFFLEIILVVLVATFIGSSLGTLASDQIGDYLTRQNIESREDQKTAIIENFGRDVDMFYLNNEQDLAVDASISFTMLLGLWTVFILVTVISTCGVIHFILCSEPVAILNERN